MRPTATERQLGDREAEVVGRGTPVRHPALVDRPRVIDRLLASPPAPLVVLSAPAGYSKTTSLVEWAREDERPFGWVAATARHADPALLVAAIADVLDQIEPLDAEVTAGLRSPKPNISDVVLPRIVEGLRGRAPFVLVIDDVHKLDSPSSFEVLEAVIEALPTGGQLALASRTEPPLRLGRMRSQRRLVELGARELAMTRVESGDLLANLGLELSAGQVNLLIERTEGWPAALYLAGLSLLDQSDLGRAVASFAGDDRVVVDYLRDEFLAATDPALIEFLVRTSILDELSGPLCDSVLMRSDSAGVLRRLARSNALVVSLDRTDTRYRYHQLFAEELRSELRWREPELEPELHARASRWYAENSDPDRAIDHAIASGDVGRSGKLIWRAFPEISGRGRLATLDRWLEQVGDEHVAATGSLALATAHRCLVLGQGDRAAHWARIAEASVDGSSASRERIEPDLLLLDATLARDGVVRMGKDAARASELHPPEAPWQAPCYLYRGVASHLTGHPERARPVLQEAARRGAVVSPIIQVLALAQLCLIAIDDDEVEDGSRLIAQARDQVSRCGLTDYPSMTMVAAASSLALSAAGHPNRAREDLGEALRLLPRVTDMPPWYEAQVRLVLVSPLIRSDQLRKAEELVAEAEGLLELTPDAAIVSAWLGRARADLGSAAEEGTARGFSLTNAELRTLEYLPSHLSFREIGERVHVSPNTVKTQAQAIYRKLGASSRAEAVERAREAGLLGNDPLGEA